MKRKISFKVRSLESERCLFERLVDSDSSISVPYDKVVPALEYLFQGLKVKVVIEIMSY